MFLKDENVIVLDFLSQGHSTGRGEPIAQVMGEKYFSLLEVIIRRDVEVKSGDRLYVGQDKRDKVDHIKKRITARDLTTFARSELPFVVEKIVKENEPKFVEFFNKSTSISTRMHQLELLPGFGKKHMWDIINQRKIGPFTSFDNLKERVKLLPDPRQAIIKRIMIEIENDDERYRIFVAGPSRVY
jgi:putative nucleotide binding protein